jgi:hypothetical protein
MRARQMLAVGLASALLAGSARAADQADGAVPPLSAPASADAAAPAGAPAPTGALAVAPAPTGAPKTKVFRKLHEPSLLHKNQFGIAIMPGIGFRIIAPYKEMVSCGEQAKRVCTGLLPFFLDVQPSFGFAEHWDVIVDLRFGIMTDFTQSRELAVAPGVR